MKTLEELRKKRNLTQMDVCLKTGLSLSGYINIERKLSRPKLETLEKLKEVFKIKNLDKYLKEEKK